MKLLPGGGFAAALHLLCWEPLTQVPSAAGLPVQLPAQLQGLPPALRLVQHWHWSLLGRRSQMFGIAPVWLTKDASSGAGEHWDNRRLDGCSRHVILQT
jgi:hypothetical protein